jgi:hypothetical protein
MRHEVIMEGKMGMEHGEQDMDHMKMMWEKLDEKTKKMVMSRMLEEKIMMKEAWIKHLQHKIDTMKMIKGAMDKM